MTRASASGRRRTMAQRADRHELYEAAVQDVDAELQFIREAFTGVRGTVPLTLREDFCGLGSLACRWVRQGSTYRATGVDIDPDVLDAGRQRRWMRLTPAERRRVNLISADVLAVRTKPVDVVTAFNFSYWVFKSRELLGRYFKSAYGGLTKGGIFVLDAFGGYEACQMTREQPARNLYLRLEQAEYLPVTGDIRCHIHFRFPDRSRLDRAFSYDWRLGTLPEIREPSLAEAGLYQESHRLLGGGRTSGAVEMGNSNPKPWVRPTRAGSPIWLRKRPETRLGVQHPRLGRSTPLPPGRTLPTVTDYLPARDFMSYNSSSLFLHIPVSSQPWLQA